MKRLLLAVILVFSFAAASIGQTWVQVAPTGGYYYKVVKTSDGKYLINSMSNTVYKSNDLTTWTATPGVLPDLATPGFFKDHTGKVFVGTESGLCYTPNNGITWNPVAGFPASYGNLADMTEDASNNLYAGTANLPPSTGGVYKSTDGGSVWSYIGANQIVDYEFVPETNQLYALGFLDNVHGNVYFTTNGINWTEVTGQPFSGSAVIIKHYGSSIYVIRNNGEIYKSTNSGVNWSYYSVIETLVGTPVQYFNDALILDNGVWWVSFKDIGLFRSSNNGLNWSLPTNFFPGNEFHYLYNDGPAVIVTTGSGIYKCVEPIYTPVLLSPADTSKSITNRPTFDWYDVPYASKYRLQVAKDQGFVNVTLDKYPLTNSHYSMGPDSLDYSTKYYWRVFAGNDYGWNYTIGQVWSFTTLIQPLWSLYNTGVPYSLFGVDFAKAPYNDIGVAVGQGGTVIKTTNAGVEWTLTYSNVNIWMNDVQFDPISPNIVWAAGMGGVIIKSTDYGDTWVVKRQFSTSNHTIRGIAVKPVAGCVSFVGYAGTFFETSNGGTNWTQRYEIPFTMHSIAYSPNFISNGKGIICGTDGKVWNTTNWGANWTARNTNRYDYLNDVVYRNDTSALICGNNGTILKTLNNGNSWTVNIQYLTSEHLRSIDAFANFVTVCGDNGKIMTSINYGDSFVDQLNGENRHMYGVALRDGDIGVVVGEVGSSANNGALYYTSMNGGGSVGITQTGSEIPQNYSVSQNYPNPFNPTTKINFALPKQGLVTIKVYDLLGKEVETLVNEVKSAGKYTVDFNGSKLSSGVYFYRIQANDFFDVKRMMLVK